MDQTNKNAKVQKTDAEWRAQLSPSNIMSRASTAPSGPSPARCCRRSATALSIASPAARRCSASDTKFESGTGWPSFYAPISKDAVTEIHDDSHGMRRTEIRCASCDAHLGHVFPDGPTPTGQRYCMNGCALDFDTKAGESVTPSVDTGRKNGRHVI